MEFELKIFLGSLAAFVAVINYWPYLYGVLTRSLRPHAFSWIIFTLITATVSVAQFTSGAGAGAWATGATSLTTLLIAMFAIRNGGYSITWSDIVSFGGAIFAIPLWLFTDNPLAAVILLTMIEILGFLPTYRKAFSQPHEESIFAFTLTVLKYTLALSAMKTYSLTTILFPGALIILSTLLIVELLWRRKVLQV